MKRILCILTALSLLLSCVPAFAADAETGQDADKMIVEKLYRLGVVNDELYSAYAPDAELTRAEFADIAAALMGVKGETNADVSRVMSDVTPDTKYASSIFQLYSIGIMIGDDEAAFYPERSITYNEAVKTAVVMLGLHDVANSSGGYSQGYREIASKRGLLSGVSGAADQALSQRSIYKLIDNLIDTPIFVIDSLSSDGTAQVTQDKDITFLSHSMDIQVYEGIVTAFEETSLKDDIEDIGEDTVRINGSSFRLSYTDGRAYVGQRVRAYCNSDDEAVYIEVSNKNSILKVMSNDIENTTTLTELHYRTENNRLKYADFDAEAVIIYNGKKLTSPMAEELVPEEGYVTLIDNDNDGKYEVISVENYEVFVVDGILAADEIIKLKYGAEPISLSESDNVKSRIFFDGEPAQITDIAKWNVISVLRSKNSSGTVLCDVYVTNNSVEGKVTQSYTDDGDYYVQIDSEDELYSLTSSYIDRVEAGEKDSVYPVFDKQTIFYLDIFGKIAAINTVSSSKNYGYVLRCYYDWEVEKAYIKLYTKDAEFVTFDVNEKIRVNGDRVEPEDLPEVMKSKTRDGNVYQLIVYDLDSDGDVNKILTAKDKTDEKFYVAKDDEFVLHYKTEINPATQNYYGLRFYKYLAENQPYYYLEGTTLNFQIPSDLSREKDFSISSKLSSTDVSLAGPIYVYDAGPGGMIGAIVSSPKDDTNFSLPAVVAKVRTTIDEDDVACKEIVFADGTSVYAKSEDVKYSYPAKLDNGTKINWSQRVDYTHYTVDDIKKGDVIEYTKLNDYVNTMRFIVKIDDIGPSRVDGDHLAKNGSIFGTAHSISDNNRTAVVQYMDYNNEERYQSLFINGTIFKIDKESGEATYSSAAEIDPGDTVLVNSFWWSAKLVFVYK